jgi:beta-aspartyl-peptidase (threonine type)
VQKVKINHGPTLVIHGGAGTVVRKDFSVQKEYLDALKESLMTGYGILLNEGNSIDAVEAAVRIMEGCIKIRLKMNLLFKSEFTFLCLIDCPLFNAGKGSVFTIGGKVIKVCFLGSFSKRNDIDMFFIE